jgi:hypothetical protein
MPCIKITPLQAIRFGLMTQDLDSILEVVGLILNSTIKKTPLNTIHLKIQGIRIVHTEPNANPRVL